MAIINRWRRTCQECFTEQDGVEPKTDTQLNKKCVKCKSESLDYGSTRLYDTTAQKFVEPKDDDWGPEDDLDNL